VKVDNAEHITIQADVLQMWVPTWSSTPCCFSTNFYYLWQYLSTSTSY